MKTIILLLMTLLAVPMINAQDLKYDEKTDRIYFSGVIEVDSVSRSDLYLRAREWFTYTYNSAEHVLQMDDKEDGILIGKAFKVIQIDNSVWIDPPIKRSIKMYYTIKVKCKDNRYRYTFTDISYKEIPSSQNNYKTTETVAKNLISDENLHRSNGKVRPLRLSYKEATIEAIELTALSLRIDMTKKVTEKDDDW